MKTPSGLEFDIKMIKQVCTGADGLSLHMSQSDVQARRCQMLGWRLSRPAYAVMWVVKIPELTLLAALETEELRAGFREL